MRIAAQAGIALFLALSCWPWARAAGQQDPTVQLLASVNGVRVANGLAPLAQSPLLNESAQRHSQDLAAGGGTAQDADGPSAFERMAAAGYVAYSTGIVGAEITYASQPGSSGSYREPFDWWMNLPDERDLLLSTIYRQVGIGVSTSPTDGRQVWTVDLGSQPNVLPVFIGGGAAETTSWEVVLTLSNEGAAIEGDGPEVMGLAAEVRIANSPDMNGATWQPWTGQAAWTLSPGLGPKTVYVEFRDRIGRTTTSQAATSVVGQVDAAEPVAVTTSIPSATPGAQAPAIGAPATAGEPAVTSPPATIALSSAAGDAVPEQTRERQSALLPGWSVLQPARVLPLVCGLQALAAVLGFLVAVRRGRPARGDN